MSLTGHDDFSAFRIGMMPVTVMNVYIDSIGRKKNSMIFLRKVFILMFLVHWTSFAEPCIAKEDAFPDIPLDPTDVKSVKTYYTEVPGSSEKKVVAVALIDAPTELVWKTVTDYSRMGKGSSIITLESMKKKEDHQMQVYLMLHLPWPLKDRDCLLLFSEDPTDHVMKWQNIGGHIAQNTGMIELWKINGKTLIKFSLTLKLGNILPQWVVNWSLRQKLPEEIRLLRKAVETRKERLQADPGKSTRTELNNE